MKQKEKYCILERIEEELSNNDDIDKEKLTILEKLSDDSDSLIRGYVAQLLVYFNTKESEEILLQLSRDEDSLVRAEACDSLCISRSYNTFNILKYIAQKDRNGMVRGYAICSLGDISTKINEENSLISFLIEQLKDEKVEFVKINIYATLYQIGAKEYLDNLLSLINTKRYTNRCAVIHSLYDVIDKSNEKKIIEVLSKRRKNEKSDAVITTIDEFMECVREDNIISNNNS